MILPAIRGAGIDADEGNIFDQLQYMLNSIYPLRTMTEAGMTEDDIAPFTKNILETKQRLLTKTYIPIKEAWIAELFRSRL